MRSRPDGSPCESCERSSPATWGGWLAPEESSPALEESSRMRAPVGRAMESVGPAVKMEAWRVETRSRRMDAPRWRLGEADRRLEMSRDCVPATEVRHGAAGCSRGNGRRAVEERRGRVGEAPGASRTAPGTLGSAPESFGTLRRAWRAAAGRLGAAQRAMRTAARRAGSAHGTWRTPGGSWRTAAASRRAAAGSRRTAGARVGPVERGLLELRVSWNGFGARAGARVGPDRRGRVLVQLAFGSFVSSSTSVSTSTSSMSSTASLPFDFTIRRR